MKCNIVLLVLIVTAVLFTIAGCASLPVKPSAPVALTPQQQLTQMVSGTNWLATLMILGVGAGFFAFLNGNSKGLQAMAACFVVLSLALGVARFSVWISASSMIGAVCLMAYTVLVKNKALKEVVKGVQTVRDNAADDSKLGGAIDNLRTMIDNMLDKAQSATTKAVVKQTKAAL